jgi:hypothetical protein
MSTHATGTFEITRWDEKPYDEIEGQPKLAHASVAGTYKGDVEGTGTIAYLMVYREDESASYVFTQRVVGRLGGRSGGFVLHGSGAYEDGVARGTWSVVPGSGTGELSGLRGAGSFSAPKGMTMNIALDYDIA